MSRKRSKKMGSYQVGRAAQGIEDDWSEIPLTDALRDAIRFSDMSEHELAGLGSRKDDPSLMDWDGDVDGWVKDHGGMDRPVLIMMGAGPWSYPRLLACPVCGGEGIALDGPQGRRYCGYCDRYGQDRTRARQHIAKTTAVMIRERRLASRPKAKT